MFDSHCHLHDRRIRDAEAQIARARAAGVTGFLLAGVGPDGWPDEDALARAHPDLHVAYGVHPQLVAELDDAASDAAVQALTGALDGTDASVRAVAVGEIGLDGLGDRKPSLDRQERAFRRQLAEARARDLPVSLHILQAHGRALALLKADGLPRAGGVMHSYSGSADLVREYLGLGLHLSFAGPVTYENAPKIEAAARAVPGERLLVETDAPFQTPAARRPATCEPAFLIEIVSALGRIRGEDPAALGAYTAENARRLFRI
jgi:TatD DNase family protein